MREILGKNEDSILSKGRLGEGFVWWQRNVRAPGAAGDFAWSLSARRNGFDASSAGLPAGVASASACMLASFELGSCGNCPDKGPGCLCLRQAARFIW